MKYDISIGNSPEKRAVHRDRAYAQRLMHQPICQGCGYPVSSDTYLDLEIFGIHGIACRECVRSNTRHTGNLEGDYE